jgi:hypothetical protein
VVRDVQTPARMTKNLKLALLGLLALPSTVAVAGYKEGNVHGWVTIFPKAAYGTLGAVRNSPNEKEWIGCHVYTEVGEDPYGNCRAVDREGKQVECSTYDPQLIEAIRSLKGDSSLSFSWDEKFMCSSITVGNYSQFEPKQP